MNENLNEWAARWGVSPVAMAELRSTLDPSKPVIMVDGDNSEAAVQANIRAMAPHIHGSMWRNNRGAVTDAEGRHVRFGLGNDSSKLDKVWKSSDLIGMTPRMSTRAGEIFGVFTAIEVKKPGWSGVSNEREKAQNQFLKTVVALGGIAGFAQSKEDYLRITGHA